MTTAPIVDITILSDLLIWRVEPQIYAFSTGTVPNYLKVGDTYRPIEKRLNEWRKHFPDLEKKFVWVAKVNDETFFRDYAIHYYLENDAQKIRLLPNVISEKYYSKEFFKDTSTQDIEDAIEDIKDSHIQNNSKYQYYQFHESRIPVTHTYNRVENYDLRPNQQETVERFKEAILKGRTNLLMYAVMRFWKSFTSMCCAVEMDANVVLIVSAKADVKGEWKKTVQSHVKFTWYNFLESNDLLTSTTIITDKRKLGEKVVIFLTLQDLQWEDIKAKHKEIFENQIDLLLIDETHFGARAEEYGKVLQNVDKRELKSELRFNDDTIDDLESTLKVLQAKVRIHLSGTPYRILMNSEFTDDDIIAFYQFSDIAEDQERWNEANLLKDEVKEWDNPYYGFPQMIRFAFNPNESSQKKMEQLRKDGITYAFSELLRPQSIMKDTSGLHKKFIHEPEIIDLLKIIDGSQNDTNILGFLDYEKIKEWSMCRHIVIVLPYRASCDALEELIKNQDFKNLGSYELINISGVESDRIYRDTQSIKDKIEKYESENKKTITLTVNRMLTGSTVPEWDTIIFLKDTSSPQEYDQAIFRLQNQYIRVYEEPNGDIVKYNMKPQTLLVDFNPNRMFQMQEHKSQIYNVNTDSNGNTQLEERIKKELEISPIIVLNNNKMTQITASDILKAVSEYSSSRSVLDEATSISIDYSLLDIPEIREVIEGQHKINSRQGLEIKASEGEWDEFDTGEEDSVSAESQKKKDSKESSEDEVENDFRWKFAMYYARLLFFAFLTNSKILSLQEMINEVENNADNSRIVTNLWIDKSILVLFQKYINPFVLSELDYKIQNINSLANDIAIPPIQRATNAMKKFGRLSDSEVVTPEFVTDKIIDIIPEAIFTPWAKLLDIASKQWEFAYAVYKRYGKEVANRFYSIPTSKIAYEFTRKLYTFLELDINNIEKGYTSYDLLETNTYIENDTLKINNTPMKFDAIVGNPPYQENISSDTSNSSLSKQLFPSFIKTAINLNPRYVSLITPSRWFTGDAQDKSFLHLREFIRENNHISKLHNFKNARELFPDVEIKGGVNYFLYDVSHEGKMEFNNFSENYKDSQIRNLFEDDLDIVITDSVAINILSKIKSWNFTSLTTITTGRNAFGIIGKPALLNSISSNTKISWFSKLRCKDNEIRYIDPELIQKNRDVFIKYKVFISKSAGAPHSDKKVIGFPYVSEPFEACTDSLFPIGKFNTIKESENLATYMKTRFLRYLVSVMKSSQNVTQLVYKFVPLQDFTTHSDIEWNTSIEEIDKQLYEKYRLSREEIEFIESMIKPMN